MRSGQWFTMSTRDAIARGPVGTSGFRAPDLSDVAPSVGRRPTDRTSGRSPGGATHHAFRGSPRARTESNAHLTVRPAPHPFPGRAVRGAGGDSCRRRAVTCGSALARIHESDLPSVARGRESPCRWPSTAIPTSSPRTSQRPVAGRPARRARARDPVREVSSPKPTSNRGRGPEAPVSQADAGAHGAPTSDCCVEEEGRRVRVASDSRSWNRSEVTASGSDGSPGGRRAESDPEKLFLRELLGESRARPDRPSRDTWRGCATGLVTTAACKAAIKIRTTRLTSEGDAGPAGRSVPDGEPQHLPARPAR